MLESEQSPQKKPARCSLTSRTTSASTSLGIVSGRTPRENSSRYGIEWLEVPGDQGRLDRLALVVLAPGHDPDRVDGRDLDPAQVAQQPVLAPGDRLAGLLDGVHLVLDADEPHDVAREPAGKRDQERSLPLLERLCPTAASPAPDAASSP